MFKIENGREHFWQWDLEQRVQVEDPTITEVHFCNKTDNCSLVVETYTDDTYDGLLYANVPNILLQNDWDIRVYAYCVNHTKFEKRFKVLPRTKPADYVYTETEVKRWEALEANINAAIEEFSEAEEQREANEQLRAQAEDERTNAFNQWQTEVKEAEEAHAQAFNEWQSTAQEAEAQRATSFALLEEEVQESIEATNEAAQKANEACEDAIVATDTINKAVGLFSNALKGSTTGAAVRIDDASPVDHDMGVKVRSKNLFHFFNYSLNTPFTSSVRNGVSFTANGDGSITLSGTNEATSAANDNIMNVYPATHLRGKNIALAKTTGKCHITIHLIYEDGTRTYNWYRSTETAAFKVMPSNVKTITVGAVAPVGFSGTETIYPQIEQGTTTTAYMPYVDVSAVTVQRLGKNLINADMWSDIFDKQADGSYKSNTLIYQSLAKRELNLPAAEYAISFYIKCPVGKSYIFQLTYEDGSQTGWWKSSTGDYIFCSYKTNGKAIKSIGVNYNAQSDEVWFKDLQIELGEKTAYEQYTEATEYPVNADGSVDGLKSIYPTTTLAIDATGAIIDVEYNRDLNKAFDELYNAIISLGGNI